MLGPQVSDRPPTANEAALVVLVPEVESLVGKFRLAHDPSAALGVPAHVTINYPFVPSTRDGAELDKKLGKLFGEVAPFDFSFRRIGRFPHQLYLPPEPAAPFRQLIERVAAAFPESPPYGGIYHDVVPHLTVADSEDEAVLDWVEAELAPLLKLRLPVQSRADKVWLIDNSSGRWQHRSAFPLRAG